MAPVDRNVDIELKYINRFPSQGNNTNGQIISTVVDSNLFSMNSSSKKKLSAAIEYKNQMIGAQPSKMQSLLAIIGINTKDYYLYYNIDRITLSEATHVKVYPNTALI